MLGQNVLDTHLKNCHGHSGETSLAGIKPCPNRLPNRLPHVPYIMQTVLHTKTDL